MRLPHGHAASRAVALAALVVATILGCQSPTPASPTPAGSGAATPGPTGSALGSGVAGTPGPSASHAAGGSPTPVGSGTAADPCRLLTADEVNSALGGGYGVGAGQGLACVFTGDSSTGNDGLVSVAVVDGDTIAPIRSRYPDLKDVAVEGGTAAWSPTVGSLWLLAPGPRTVIVSILGKDLPDDQLQQVALQLAQLAAGRI